MQQEIQTRQSRRRTKGRRTRRALRQSLILSAALFLTVSTAFSFPTLANGYADSLFGYVTILNSPSLVSALRAAQSSGVVMAVHGWRHENFSQLSPDQAKQLVAQSIQVFDQAGLVPKAFVEPYDSVLPPAVASAIESQGLPITLPHTVPYEFLNASYEYLYTWGWRNMTSYNDPRLVGAEAMIIQQQPRYVVLHVQDWNNYSKRLMQVYLGSTARTDVVVRVDDLSPNTSPAAVNDMTTLMNYKSLQVLAFAIIPSAPLDDNHLVAGVGTSTILDGYWVYYVATAFLPACFLFIWRYTSDDDSDPDDSPKAGVFETPKVSVIIPAYNEADGIDECLGSILKQDYRGTVEVIVVDDGSTDSTAAAASKYPVRMISLPANKGKANALNTGVKESTGEVLVFSDSDSHLERNSLRLLVEYLQRNRDVGAVAGCLQVNGTGKNLLTYFQAMEYRIGQEVDKFLQGRSAGVLVCPGPLFAVRRDVALQFPFNENSVIEDADFSTRLLKAGLQVGLENEAFVYTDVPRSVAAWSRQRKRWWAGFLELWKTHKPWARRNPWMLHNYILGYVTSLASLALLLFVPFLAATYAIPGIEVERGLLFALFPIAFFMALYAPFFVKEKKLILLLPLYSTVYFLMKTVLLASLYVRYLFGVKYRVQFGSRRVLVRW
ncbi:MAG TPA: glycosyltransferase [Nitrososphaerales archaeon]|nr:glycosyltransferase [Nitrososphaerales archaeon]